jgi:hypothetical protein
MLNYTTYEDLPEEKLEKWLDLKMNLLLIGGHGVGKTSIIKNFFDKKGLKSIIFSGATLDPWTDLVGIPYHKGDGTFEMAKPSSLPLDVEAIFVDEYNRSHPKVRNALLELTQFGSINGQVMPNLKIVWAAINDDKTLYDVDEIDPAQSDRFHVHYKLEYRPNKKFMSSKYGEQVAANSISWWDNLGDKEKILVSPRRLDYALEYAIFNDGDLRDILPDRNLNVPALATIVQGSPTWVKFQKLVDAGKEEDIQEFLNDARNFQTIYSKLIADSRIFQKVAHLISCEKINGICSSNFPVALLAYDAIRKTNSASKYDSFPWWTSAKIAMNGLSGKVKSIEDSLSITDKTPTMSFRPLESVDDFLRSMSKDGEYKIPKNSIKNWVIALKDQGVHDSLNYKAEMMNQYCIASLLADGYKVEEIIKEYHYIVDKNASIVYSQSRNAATSQSKPSQPQVNRGPFKEEEL